MMACYMRPVELDLQCSYPRLNTSEHELSTDNSILNRESLNQRKMLTTKQFQFPLNSIIFFVYTMEVNGNQNGLVTNIFQYYKCWSEERNAYRLEHHEDE